MHHGGKAVPVNAGNRRIDVELLSAEVEKYRNMILDTSGLCIRSSMPMVAFDLQGIYNFLLVFHSDLISLCVKPLSSYRHTPDAPEGPLCENMMTSTKPEVYNVSQAVRERPSHGHRQYEQNIW